MLSRPLDVENKRVARGLEVYYVVISIACAASIEAGQTHVQASWIVDGVEALRAVFSVHRLIRSRSVEVG